MKDFLKELNKRQLDAVKNVDGPMLIVAGAGSGKTRVITYKIAYIIAESIARPEEITAVTFTNKATQEMRDRINYILNEKTNTCSYDQMSALTVLTFHSYCSRVLRSHIDRIGIPRDFLIYDAEDQKSLICKILDKHDMDRKEHNPKEIISFFSSVKNGTCFIDKSSSLFDVYNDYIDGLKKANALDFGDLLRYTLKLFSEFSDVLEIYQDKARYLFVDEYQDTNRIQYQLIKLLSSKHRNICVVGDEDQSIYKWRGADIRNILDFEKDYKDAKVIKLEQNYRSTSNIIGASSSLISKNKQRKDKTLFTKREKGKKLSLMSVVNDIRESEQITEKITKLVRDGYNYDDIAIFYRINAQSRLIEDGLRKNRIPYKIVGGMRFYDRKEIKDLISYLRVIANPDDSVSLMRIINVPGRGIGKTTINKLSETSLKKGKSIYSVISEIDTINGFSSAVKSKIRHFRDLMDELRSLGKETQSISIILKTIIDRTNYIEFLKNKTNYEADERIDNVSELLGAITEYEDNSGIDDRSLSSFLENIALIGDTDQEEGSEGGVRLMTLHSAKGLEFKVVFIQGVEYGLIPYIRYGSEDVNDLEEERRLMYVGMTRAMERLYLSWARSRRIFGGIRARYPSKFLDDIDQSFVEISTDESDFVKQQSKKNTYRTKSSREYIYDAEYNTASYNNFSQVTETGTMQIVGSKVRHSTYGYGIVRAIEGKGDKAKVTVNFSRHGVKKLIWGYANLTVF